VAQKFSTRVTGLPSSLSGIDSVMPAMPVCAVPSQYASTSCFDTPVVLNSSLVASMIRSSADLSQCSANLVQPMPTIATRSLMP
jgi:hypothetical protein